LRLGTYLINFDAFKIKWDMEHAFETVMKSLTDELEANERETCPLKRLSSNIESVKSAICDLFNDATFNLGYSLDEEMHIQCNKHLLPRLFGQLQFFEKCYQLECLKQYSTAESSVVFCEKELDAAGQFFRIHGSFCQYYHSGKTEEDWLLFTRRNCEEAPAELDVKEYLPVDNLGCLRWLELRGHEILLG
jgi:hypothetical protein